MMYWMYMCFFPLSILDLYVYEFFHKLPSGIEGPPGDACATHFLGFSLNCLATVMIR